MTELTIEQAAAEDELVQEVHQVLDRHYVTWRDFSDVPGVDAGEWYCGCGRTFEFSSGAVDHQTGEVIALVSSRLAAAASDALIDATRELDRLHAIGSTSLSERVSDEDWSWFRAHPLRTAAQTRVAGILCAWLRDRAGDDDQGKAVDVYACCRHCGGDAMEPCKDVVVNRRRHVEPCSSGCGATR